MNLFRRRSSASTSPPSTPTTSTTTTTSMTASTTTTTNSTSVMMMGSGGGSDKNGATASLRRVFMPRSKTASSNLGTMPGPGPEQPMSMTISRSSNGCLAGPSSVTAVTNWSYIEPRVPPTSGCSETRVSGDNNSTLQRRPPPPMPPSRTASLTRNFNHSRSITMPNMQEHQQQQSVDTSNSFARTFSTFRRHQDNIGNSRRMSTADRGSSCNNNNNFTTSPSMPAYMTLSSTSTISASVSIHGGLSSTTPRFQQQQRQSRLPDQQHQQLPQQLPSQQQFRRRPRPLSADMSMTRTPYNTYANSNHNNVHNPNHPMAMSTSKSEFFRVVRNRLMEEFEGSNDPRHHSSESLLADSSSVSMESSLDYFVNQDQSNLNEDDDEGLETPTPTTPDVSSQSRKAISSLDSLLDNESSGGGISIQSQMLTMSSRAKSNSLPKSAFGSLQLKVQEIRAQLDVLKTSSDVRRVLHQVCPPPRPQGQENTQHPNTPAHGFEYMMPPNVVQEQNSASSWSNYFPVFPTSAIDASGCSSNPDRRPFFPPLHPQHQHHNQQQQQHHNSMFQSPPSSSQDTDSVSPLSLSPSRTSSPATAQPATLSSSMAPSHSSAGAAITMMGTSGSSSPSTLSASSSNSLPTSVSRPSVLKIPHSQSLNSFPYNNNNNNNNNNNCNNNLKNYSKGYFDDDAAVSQVGRLFFFYDVLSTQEKISKVGWLNQSKN